MHAGIRPSSFLYQASTANIRKIWDFETSSRAPESIISIMDGKHMRDHSSQTMSNEQLTFLAPEQTGRTAYPVDNRTDLYSLGITFFYMLSQTLPFLDQDPRAILRNILTKPLPLSQELKSMYPAIIWAIIEKLTSKVCCTIGTQPNSVHVKLFFFILTNIHSIPMIDINVFRLCVQIYCAYRLSITNRHSGIPILS